MTYMIPHTSNFWAYTQIFPFFFFFAQRNDIYVAEMQCLEDTLPGLWIQMMGLSIWTQNSWLSIRGLMHYLQKGG